MSVAISVKRTRARGPKVKTGCTTCKIRHVKCDEGKPSCLRCTSTGRTCDGYAVAVSKATGLRSLKKAPTQAISITAAARIPQSPSTAISRVEVERRGFYFFETRTGKELFRTLTAASLSTPLLMQMIHVNPAVMHSAVALGLMGERLERNEVCTFDDRAANAVHLAARIQYQKALASLRSLLERDDDTSVWAALTACTLLTCFEFLQGDGSNALTHVTMGAHILRTWRSRYLLSEAQAPSKENREVLDGMSLIFGILDVQGNMWLKRSGFVYSDFDHDNFRNFEKRPPIPDSFEDVEAARADYELLRGRIMGYSRTLSVPVLSDQKLEWLRNSRNGIIADMERWPIALAATVAQKGHKFTENDRYHVTALKIQYLLSILLFQSAGVSDEEDFYRSKESTFGNILKLARPLLIPVNVIRGKDAFLNPIWYDPDVDPMPTFTFCDGLIEPLFYTATKCENPAFSEEAIQLLMKDPWREGAWDSAAMARIAIDQVSSKRALLQMPPLDVDVSKLFMELHI